MTFSTTIYRDEVEIPLEVECQYVDNGIGPYEYWGARGFDSQPDVEILSVTDASGKEFILSDEEEARIHDIAFERIMEEPDYDDEND